MTVPGVGDTLDGRYHLRRVIGLGGMSTVFEATHAFTGRSVAIKLLLPEYATHSEVRERLLREARALGEVRHPHVVEVFDAGIASGDHPYVAMEMLDGRSLEGLLAARTRLPVVDAVRVCRQVCEALKGLHARGLVHRDIKPGNLFVVPHPTQGELVKVIDLGIALAVPREGRRLTGSQVVVGTPEYMAPEQLLNAEGLDGRADLYALAVTLFECLAGTVPFAGSYQEVLIQHATRGVPSVRALRPEVPVSVAAHLERALAPDPAARFPDAGRFLVALEGTGLASGRTRLLEHLRPEPAAPPRPSSPEAPPPEETPSGPRGRRHPRAPYATPVRLVRGSASGVDGRSEDISEGGMLVLTLHSVAQGERVHARFALPASGEIVSCPAQVRWVRERPGASRAPRAVGLEFISLAPAVRDAIARYVSIVGAPSDQDARAQGPRDTA